MWYNSLWLWRRLPQRLSKRQSTPRFKPFTVPEVFMKVSSAQFPSVSLRRTPLELALSVHHREMIESQIKGLRKAGANFRYPLYRGVGEERVNCIPKLLWCFRYIRSLQHSVAWGARGGKSGSAFFKSFGEYGLKSPLSNSTVLCGQSNRWCNSSFYEQLRRWEHVPLSNFFCV